MTPRDPDRSCFRCGATVNLNGLIGREEVCPQCGADLHVCKNCQFYQSGAYNDCREPQAERVVDKERANFCDFFTYRTGPGAADVRERGTREQLESLFRRHSP